jgi:hypothetical protein
MLAFVIANAVGAALERICPSHALEDPVARVRCADALAEDATLSASMFEGFKFTRFDGTTVEI